MSRNHRLGFLSEMSVDGGFITDSVTGERFSFVIDHYFYPLYLEELNGRAVEYINEGREIVELRFDGIRLCGPAMRQLKLDRQEVGAVWPLWMIAALLVLSLVVSR